MNMLKAEYVLYGHKSNVRGAAVKVAKIVINHLASIRHIEMDINQMNLFIGEQATGKSTLCKAIYFFRNVKEILLDYYYTVGQDGESQKG